MKDAINFTVFLFGMLIALLWAWMKLFVWFCEWIFEPFVKVGLEGFARESRD